MAYETEITENGIVTTEQEKEAFIIIKSILRTVVPVDKIFMRDKLSYCGVLYEDNNRKPICRFYFNSEKVKYIAIMDENKQEVKHKIDTLDKIYNLSEELIKAVSVYIQE